MREINLLNLISSHNRLGSKRQLHVFFGLFMTKSWCEVLERFFMWSGHQITQADIMLACWNIWINLMWGYHQIEIFTCRPQSHGNISKSYWGLLADKYFQRKKKITSVWEIFLLIIIHWKRRSRSAICKQIFLKCFS